MIHVPNAKRAVRILSAAQAPAKPKSQCALFALDGIKRLMCRTELKFSNGIHRRRETPNDLNGMANIISELKAKLKIVFISFCALWDAAKDLSFLHRQRKRENHTQTTHKHTRVRQYMQFRAGTVTMWRRLQSCLCVRLCQCADRGGRQCNREKNKWKR